MNALGFPPDFFFFFLSFVVVVVVAIQNFDFSNCVGNVAFCFQERRSHCSSVAKGYFSFLARPVTCRSSLARDQTQATVMTMSDP